jgi:hypothetical protein
MLMRSNNEMNFKAKNIFLLVVLSKFHPKYENSILLRRKKDIESRILNLMMLALFVIKNSRFPNTF